MPAVGKGIAPPSLVREDPALPALPGLFPASGVPEFVSNAVRAATGLDLQPNDGVIEFIRYRPAKNCVVLWSFPDRAGGHLLVTGTIAHDDEIARVPARPSFQELARAAQAARSDLRQLYMYLEQQQLLLQIYPLDVRLPGLPLIESEAWRRETLLPALGIDAAAAVGLTALSYKARRRCVYRLDVAHDGDASSYIAKTFRDDRGERLFASLRAIDGHMRAAGAPWQIPTPVAYVPDAWLLVFEAAQGGIEMKDMLKRARDDEAARSVVKEQFELAAAGLAALQQAPGVDLPVISPQRLLARFVSNMDGLAQVDGALFDLLLRRIGELEDEAEGLPRESFVPTHGAFRHDQILLCEHTQVVLDLDTVCRSGASADAGNFLSYLDVTALRRRRLRPAIEACTAAFEEAALRVPGVSADWMAWYRAAGHVKKALRSFLSLDRKWPQMAESLLGERVAAFDEAVPQR